MIQLVMLDFNPQNHTQHLLDSLIFTIYVLAWDKNIGVILIQSRRFRQVFSTINSI